MLWVVTFSVFLPSFTSSSVVWANPGAAQNPRSATHSQKFFMIVLPCAQDSVVSIGRVVFTLCPNTFPVCKALPARPGINPSAGCGGCAPGCNPRTTL